MFKFIKANQLLDDTLNTISLPKLSQQDLNILENGIDSDNISSYLSFKPSTNPGDYPDIRHFESWAMNQPIEYAMAYDANGKAIYIAQGEKSHVTFPQDVLTNPAFVGMTHNHPDDSPLSPTDFKTSSNLGINTRAVNNNVYEFNPGWLQGRNAQTPDGFIKGINSYEDTLNQMGRNTVIEYGDTELGRKVLSDRFKQLNSMLEQKINNLEPNPDYPLFGVLRINQMTGHEPYARSYYHDPVNIDFEILRDSFAINNRGKLENIKKVGYSPRLGYQ